MQFTREDLSARLHQLDEIHFLMQFNSHNHPPNISSPARAIPLALEALKATQVQFHTTPAFKNDIQNPCDCLLTCTGPRVTAATA